MRTCIDIYACSGAHMCQYIRTRGDTCDMLQDPGFGTLARRLCIKLIIVCNVRMYEFTLDSDMDVSL